MEPSPILGVLIDCIKTLKQEEASPSVKVKDTVFSFFKVYVRFSTLFINLVRLDSAEIMHDCGAGPCDISKVHFADVGRLFLGETLLQIFRTANLLREHKILRETVTTPFLFSLSRIRSLYSSILASRKGRSFVEYFSLVETNLVVEV